MPSKQQLETALINADKAGDVEAASILATAIKSGKYDVSSNISLKPNATQSSEFPDLSVKPIETKNNLDDLSISERALHVIKDIPRAGGVAVRNTLEGAGELVDFIGTPLAASIEYATGRNPRGMGKYVADKLNLPKSEPGLESIVSEGQKLVASGGGFLGLAGKAQQLAKGGSIAQKALQAAAIRPDLQLSSAIGSGIAGGAAKEAGADPLTQAIASLAGGIAAPVGVAGVQQIIQSAKNAFAKTNPAEMSYKINTVIESALKEKGITLDQISSSVKSQLKNDMDDMLKKGQVSPDVVRRLIDHRIVGTTPTAGSLTLDPGIITRQKNLAKLGANSQDPNLQKLSQIENQNNKQLISKINDLGAGSQRTTIEAGQNVIDSFTTKLASQKENIDLLYKNARAANGRSASLDPRHFTEMANNMLDESLLGGKLPSDVRVNLNKIANGEIPLTVDVAEQLKTNIATLQRSTNDKAEKLALGMVRSALDKTNLSPGQEIGSEAISAFNKARSANAKMMKQIEDVPALKAVYEGIDPDKFIQSYIISNNKDSSVNNVRKLATSLSDSPETLSAIKNNLTKHLKNKAISGSSDEVGIFSQSGYNRALSSIGDDKLKLFFTNKEILALKAVGRVASYEQIQPKGSAVNNSNTASALLGSILDKIGSSQLIRKIPLGAEMVGNPLKTIQNSREALKLTKLPVAKLVKENRGIPPILLPYLISENPENNN